MRISDWSSDVCSSDLRRQRRIGPRRVPDLLKGDGRGRGKLVTIGAHDRADLSRIDCSHPAQRAQPLFLQFDDRPANKRSEEHTSELQSLMRISYAVFCLKKTKALKQQTESELQQQITTQN